MKRVIDADRGVILERFNPEDTAKILAKYTVMDRWSDIGVDKDGDIILWE